MNAMIVTLPGDGVGPEVVSEAVTVLGAVAGRFGHAFTFTEHLIGGCSMDRHGVPLAEDALAACKAADAVLLGAVGGPRWDNPAAGIRPEQGLLALRKSLGLFANLRPVKPHPSLTGASPLRGERLRDVDILFVRELTGGLYFGQPRGRYRVNGSVRSVDTLEYHDYEIDRVVDLAFRLAAGRKNKVTSVDKANVLETSRLWRQVAERVREKYRTIGLEHVLVDTAAMRLISAPASFDVIVTENMFGDILTDEASVITGSMGMLPSASLGEGSVGVYEPVHGSAPDITGKGIANPIGAILSAAMLLRHSLKLGEEASCIELAVDAAIADGARTCDLGGQMTTKEMTREVLQRITIRVGR